MKKLLIILVIIISSIFTYSQVPQKLSYQGVLTDNSGNPLNGSYNITFKLYSSSSGGSAIWQETQSLNVNNGLLNAYLGSVTNLSIEFGSTYWLGVTVDAGTELTPRVELTSVPYSLVSKTVEDGSITTDKILDGAVTSSKLDPSLLATVNPWQNNGSTLFYNGGRVFIGRDFPITSNEYFGVRAPVGDGIYGGMYVETQSANGLPFYGFATSGVLKSWLYYNGLDSTINLYHSDGIALTISPERRLGIGTSEPTHEFELVHGSFGAINTNNGLKIRNSGSNNVNWTLYSYNGTGNFGLFEGSTLRGTFAAGTGAYTTASDERLKKDITPVQDLLPNVMQLETKKYRYTNDNSGKQIIGFLAQDLEKLFPEFVYRTGENAESYSVDYAGLSVVALKAIQEQQKLIEQLQAEVNELKSRSNK